MSFNSFEFAVFWTVVISIYWLMPLRLQNLLLLAASYVFYAGWDWRFLSLIMISTCVDYVAGLRIHAATLAEDASSRTRGRIWLTASICTNLGLLGFFKYCNFFAESTVELFHAFGLEVSPVTLNIVLPVGISFYTFQTMSYTIDIYRRKMAPTRNFLDFALFVAFFPQLVAGPIERAAVLLPQITAKRSFSTGQFTDGLHLIFWGLFKKVYVADNLAPFVDQVFAGNSATGLEVLFGAYAFALQIYCDFSGYSDVARGCAKCMGLELMLNFNHPYVADSPSDFWRRWHISLSTWLRDYLYIPLGGNRQGAGRTCRNLMLTMLLGGLWHGAEWKFVVWGGYHGLLLILFHSSATRTTDNRGQTASLTSRVGRAGRVFVMFHLTCLGWLIFRGQSVGQVSGMLQSLVTAWAPSSLETMWPLVIFGGPLLVVEILQLTARTDDLHGLARVPDWAKCIAYSVLFYLFAFHGAAAQSFIYFQF
ncbi:MBOAT family O-acyltransferase [Bacteroidota bacterium]